VTSNEGPAPVESLVSRSKSACNHRLTRMTVVSVDKMTSGNRAHSGAKRKKDCRSPPDGRIKAPGPDNSARAPEARRRAKQTE
jgi:hypothetical protein